MNKVHMISDQYSIVYIKRIGDLWNIIFRDSWGDWHTMGKHRLLVDAKRDVRELMK